MSLINKGKMKPSDVKKIEYLQAVIEKQAAQLTYVAMMTDVEIETMEDETNEQDSEEFKDLL